MTREEAIEKLELMRQKVDEETYRALILAIKALEQEPCETSTNEPMTMVYPTIFCEDAISRTDALKVASDECQEFRGIYGRIEDGIQKLPSVTPKPIECEDAISREAVLEKLNEWDWQELYLPIHFKEYIIDELPSVTPSYKECRTLDEFIEEQISAELKELATFENVDVLVDVMKIIDKYTK